jgi:PAS domain S-box-containing protein
MDNDDHAASILGSLIEGAADAIITTDLDGLINRFNAAAEMLFGCAAPELIGQHISALVPPLRRSEFELWLRLVTQEGRALRGDTEVLGNDGQIIQTYVSMSPLKDAHGTIVGALLFCVDISMRLTLQNVMQKERDLLEAILETTNDAIIMVDSARWVVSANLQFETFFHLARYQIINQPVEVLTEQIRMRPDLPDELVNILLTFVGDAYQSAGGDFEIGGPQLRILVWYSSPVYAHDGTNMGRLFVFRDATREREVDRMKTEFVSLVSHELRTPLTSILGFTDFILDGDAGPVGGQVREYLDIVKINTGRLIGLINDILDVTRIEAGRVDLKRSLCFIDELIDSVVQSMFLVIDSRRQQLTLKIEPDLPPLWVDRERIAQAFTNLLSNASKYSPADSELIVEARLVREPEDFAAGAPPDIFVPAIQVAVHDRGMGIAPQDQKHLFTRFYRAEQAARRQIAGTGLGLAIAKSFIDLHNGHIWFQSRLGYGSSFYFSIPLVEVE